MSAAGADHMKKTLAYLVISFALAISASAQEKTAKAAKTKTKESAVQSAADQQIRHRMDEVWAAWSTLDVKNAAKFYSKDPELVFYDVTPLKYSGWSEYERGVQKVLQSFKSVKCRMNDDARVWSRGDAALGTATVHLDMVTQDGKSQSADWRWTVIYEKQNGQWMIVHEHVSAPLP
jgi:ketosteroid isomerase-like protein